MRGYDALGETVAFLPDMDRYVVRVRGERAERVLGGLLTQTIQGMGAGSGRYGFFLDPKGRVVADVRVLPALDGVDPHGDAEGSGTAPGAGYWLDVPGAAREALDAHLVKYVPPIFAETGPTGVHVASLLGPRAAHTLVEAAIELGAAPPVWAPAASAGANEGVDPEPLSAAAWDLGDPGRVVCVAREPIEVPGIDLYLTDEQAKGLEAGLAGAVRAAGGAVADLEAWDAARVERGLPVYGRELTPDRLAQEAGQDERAIRFDKGCYTGQEVVARIHYRGHVNRHLRGIRFATDPDGPPAPGARLFLDGRAIGLVTSVAVSPRLGPIGLAYVRREVEPGARVSLEADAPPDQIVSPLPFT